MAAGAGLGRGSRREKPYVQETAGAGKGAVEIPWYVPFVIGTLVVAALFALLGPTIGGVAVIATEIIVFSLTGIPTATFFLRARNSLGRAKLRVADANGRLGGPRDDCQEEYSEMERMRDRLKELLDERERQPSKIAWEGYLGGLAIVGASSASVVPTGGLLLPLVVGAEISGGLLGGGFFGTQLGILDRNIREQSDRLQRAIDRYDECKAKKRRLIRKGP